MARLSTKFLIFTFILALFLLAISVPGMAREGVRECRKVGQNCGGIEGLGCCEGLFCYPGDFVAGGTCIKKDYYN